MFDSPRRTGPTLYISCLVYNCQEKHINDYFSKFGTIERLRMCIHKGTGDFLGRCFLRYNNDASHVRAIELVNEKVFGGCVIRVGIAKFDPWGDDEEKEMNPYTCFYKGFPASTEFSYEKFFANLQCEVQKIWPKPGSGSGLVRFKNVKSAVEAVRQLQGRKTEELDGYPCGPVLWMDLSFDHLLQPYQRNPELCTFFGGPRGCRHGQNCKNIHQNGGSETAKPSVSTHLPTTSEPRICTFYGTPRGCRHGVNCRNLHQDPTTEVTKPHLSALGSPTSQNPQICTFFGTPRGCMYGDKCRNVHQKPLSEVPQLPSWANLPTSPPTRHPTEEKHTYAESHGESRTSTKSRFCLYWNQNRCTNRTCTYPHQCEICSSKYHGATSCDFVSRLLQRKGGEILEIRNKIEGLFTKMISYWTGGFQMKGFQIGAKRDGDEVVVYQKKIELLERARNEFTRAYKEQKTDEGKSREIRLYDAGLPFYSFRQELLNTIKQYPVTIVIGQTGSGKSTQMAQYMHYGGVGSEGIIACTQPRKVAAISLARRVAEECTGDKNNVGKLVGFRVGMNSKISRETKILYMTDAMLLSEMIDNPTLKGFSAVIVDEAHERMSNTDIVLGQMKKLSKMRPNDLKVVVTSATINESLFAEYFDYCPVFKIPGRTFPVDISYKPPPNSSTNIAEHAQKVALQIHRTEPSGSGDILVFLSGTKAINTAVQNTKRSLEEKKDDSCVVLPLHGQLSADEQDAALQRNENRKRKILFSTNIAETSVTVDGLVYVIDTGLANITSYDAETRVSIIEEREISQSSANQRAGRAGRTQSGKCYRLYSHEQYQSMLEDSVAEILRSDLTLNILKMKCLGISDIVGFPFIEPPPILDITSSMLTLRFLKALDNDAEITPVGRLIERLNMDPMVSVMMLSGIKLGIANEMIAIASALAWNGDIFHRYAMEDKIKFSHSDGDLLTYLKAVKEFSKCEDTASKKVWCKANSAKFRNLSRVLLTYKSLIKDLQSSAVRLNLDLDIPAEMDLGDIDVENKEKVELVRRAICYGFFMNLLVQNGPAKAGYLVPRAQQNAFLHPGTVFKQNNQYPRFAVYRTLRKTSRLFLHDVTEIDPWWLMEANTSFAYSIGLPDLMSHTLVPISFKNLTKISFFALAGKKNNVVGRLEKKLGVLIEPGDQGKIDVWARHDRIEETKAAISEEIEKTLQVLQEERSFVSLEGGIQCVYGPGGEASNVLFEGEYMRLMWRNLPSDFPWTKKSVCDELKQVEESDLMSVERANRDVKKSNGVLTFYNPQTAKIVAEAHKSHTVGGEECSMVPYTSGETRELTHSNSKLTFEYYLGESKQQGYVMFQNIQDAQEAQARVSYLPNNGVRPYRVKCKIAPQGGAKYVQMKLYNLAPTLDERGICDVFQKAKYAKVYRTAPTVSLKSECARIRSTFSKYADEDGIMVYNSEDRNKLHGVKVYGHINFKDQEKAMRAEVDFGVARAGILGQGKLYVKKDTSVIVNVHSAVTRTLKDDIENLIEALKRIYPSLVISIKTKELKIEEWSVNDVSKWVKVKGKQYEKDAILFESNRCDGKMLMNGDLGFMKDIPRYRFHKLTSKITQLCAGRSTIKIDGMNLRSIRDAKTQIDTLIAPEVYECEKSTDLDVLRDNRSEVLRKIERETDCYLHWDWRKNEIRLFGAQLAKDKASVRLTEEIRKLEISKIARLRIRLPPGAAKIIISAGGITELQKKTGASVSWQGISDFLFIEGSEDCVAKCKEILIELGVLQFDENMCGICFVDIEANETTVQFQACSHIVHKECVEYQIKSILAKDLNNNNRPVKCVKCSDPICIQDIRGMLNSFQIAEFWNLSFDDFIAKNGDKYGYCLTPDCGQVYKKSADTKVLCCTKCGEEYCTECSEKSGKSMGSHRGISCDDSRLSLNDEDVYAKLLENSTLCKRCPKCRAVTYKNGGCNHMTCVSCRNHYCWTCEYSANSGSGVYSHMKAAHGGYY